MNDLNIVRPVLRTVFCGMLAFSASCSGEQAPHEPSPQLQADRPDIVATNAFYYYRDVDAAWRFYRDTLGFETVVDYGFAKILRLAESSYLTVVQADQGMHSADEAKIVSLHLVTDQLNTWHQYLVQQGAEIENDGAAGDSLSGNSFSTFDTEGYRLRFERYNPHPDHSAFVEAFAVARPVPSTAGAAAGMSVRATVLSLYYNDVAAVRPFFEGLFGVSSTAFLNGVPIYQLAGSGFVTLENFGGPELSSPGENGMTLSFLTSDVDAWFGRASSWPGFELRTTEVLNEGGLVRVFVGYDPAGIFLEWDTFLEVPENRILLEYLQ